jgi:hypothetical protein
MDKPILLVQTGGGKFRTDSYNVPNPFDTSPRTMKQIKRLPRPSIIINKDSAAHLDKARKLLLFKMNGKVNETEKIVIETPTGPATDAAFNSISSIKRALSVTSLNNNDAVTRKKSKLTEILKDVTKSKKVLDIIDFGNVIFD